MKRLAMLAAICLIPVFSHAQQNSSATKLLVFSHVTVIDGTGAPPRPDQTVVLEGDRIMRIGPASQIGVPKNAQFVDAHGLYLIPGLWDMHVHIWETKRAFPMFIANGILSEPPAALCWGRGWSFAGLW